MRKRILVADGDPVCQGTLIASVASMGFEPVAVSDGAEAIARLSSEPIDLCLTDVMLPGPEVPRLDGYAVLAAARRHEPLIPVVMVRGEAQVADAVKALRAGAAHFLPKPCNPAVLEEALRRVLSADRADLERAHVRPTSSAAVVGDHPLMRELVEKVECVADTDATVLLRGETGTGKEVIARLIHASGRQSAGPFVAVNMAALPQHLAESELFGHVRGAFTGADRHRIGRFMAADGGTLFLDEIGDLSRGLQAKLLRVMQERAVTPVGGVDPIPVNARIIAATHRNLEEMVSEGAFRDDLFYRLDVVPIEVPPLRHRRADIPDLVEHFRCDVNAREGRAVPGFSAEVHDKLCAYDWPGNVRELENLVERLVVIAGNREVGLRDLPAHMRYEPVDWEARHLDLPVAGVDLRGLLTQLEDRLIGQALARTGGNKNRAAELLGMNRTTLVEKLRRRNVA